jgi:hypothetical protein
MPRTASSAASNIKLPSHVNPFEGMIARFGRYETAEALLRSKARRA